MKWFSTLSFERRNQLLLLMTCLFAVGAYLISIRPTVELWQANRQQEETLAQLQQAPVAMQQLQAQTKYYGQLMQSFRHDSTRQEGYALNQITRSCRRFHVTLASLSPGESTRHNGYLVETRTAKLRGGFQGLAQVVYELEYQHPVGHLSSVRFAVEEDRKQRRSFLFAYLYLQTISSGQEQDAEN